VILVCLYCCPSSPQEPQEQTQVSNFWTILRAKRSFKIAWSQFIWVQVQGQLGPSGRPDPQLALSEVGLTA